MGAYKLISHNRRAGFKYQLSDKYEAGLVLQGSEVKALRTGKAHINESHVTIRDGEAFLIGSYISPYNPAAQFGHEPTRTRKLLLHQKEIHKITAMLDEKGFTLIPTKLYFSDKGKAKVEIALGKGKNIHDKRETLKKRVAKRDIDRELRKKR